MRYGVSLILLFLFFFPFSECSAEGSKQLYITTYQTGLFCCNDFVGKCNNGNGNRSQFAVYGCNEPDRLYFITIDPKERVYMGFNGENLISSRIIFRVKDIAGNIVYSQSNLPTTGGKGYINDINEARAGPLQIPGSSGGYWALDWTPAVPDTFYIEFNRVDEDGNVSTGTYDINLFDISVYDSVNWVEKPGRLFSKAWQFTEDTRCSATTYVYSNDSIITSAQFNNMQGGTWIQFCNQWGCMNTGNFANDRKSLYHPTTATYLPQYRIFLNPPDQTIFPPATTLGNIIPPVTLDRSCITGHILFHVIADKPGNVEITLTFPSSPYITRKLAQVVVVGENIIDWDGLDGTSPTGVSVVNNTLIDFTVSYINGLTNMPFFDVEKNINGFTIGIVAPAGATPAVYWDDSNLPSGTSNLTGCTSPPGCHTWSGFGIGSGDLNTINTWWYNVSTTSAIVGNTNEFRGPQTLTFQQIPPVIVCENSVGNIFSVVQEANSDEYYWSYNPSAGVTIHQPTPGSYEVTVDFGPGATSGFLSVYGRNSNCNIDGPVSSIAVTVKSLPLPAINGPDNICVGASGNTYVTQSGKSDYQWTVSPGGTITAGGGTGNNTVTVTWNTAGPQFVSVNFSENNCTASSPTIYDVTVNPLPEGAVSASSPTACQGAASPSITFTGSTGTPPYTFSYNINGGATQTITTVTGNSISVPVSTASSGIFIYSLTGVTDGNSCFKLQTKSIQVQIYALPIVSVSGNNSVCFNIPGNVYSTQPGKSNYIWSVTGGTITAGGTTSDNTVTVTWNTVGMQSVYVIYTDPATGCTADSPPPFPVNVKPLPVPTLSGPAAACINTPGPQYTTEPGMSGYSWTVIGGTYTYGPTNDIINVIWNTLGTQTVSVNYTGVNGCTAPTPIQQQVQVDVTPEPSLSGNSSICTGIPTIYTTDAGAGNSNYSWTVSAGGTINSGLGTNSISVTWNTPGVNNVSVNYSLGTGCSALLPTAINVTVNQSTPPVIQSSVNPVCESYTSVYSTQNGNSAYTWTISPGGTVIAGGGPANNTVTVRWNTPGAQYVRVNFANQNGCVAPSPTEYSVTVNPLPNAVINGSLTVCQDYPTLYQYQTAVIEAAPATYSWQITGASNTINPNATANPINVNWNASGNAIITVNAVSALGCPNNSTETVIINPKPDIALTSCFDLVTSRSAKRFQLKGGSPRYSLTGSPLQGEYLVTPSTTALQVDINGNYYFNPSLIPGVNTMTYSISYRYTNKFGCPNTSIPVNITVLGPNSPCGTTMTDPRDGKVYTTSVLGGRCWMTQNLNFNKNLGVNAINTPQTDNCVVERYCPPSDPTCSSFGAYYQWNELVQYQSTDAPYQGVCPPGWHVPTETEWQNLIDNLDPAFTPPAANALVGAELKDPSKSFKAYLEGINYLNSNTWNFTSVLTASMFWTSTPDGSDRAIARGLNNPYNSSISRYSSSHANAFPVRCLKD